MHTPDFDQNEVLRDALSGLTDEVPPMPEGLHAAWMQKVEDDKMEKTHNRKAITRFLSIAAALVFVVGGTFLTRDSLAPRSDAAGAPALAYSKQAVTDEAVEEAVYDGAPVNGAYTYTTGARMMSAGSGARNGASTPAAPTEKKIIRTASMTLRTQTFGESLSGLRALCEQEGGWVESSTESTNSRTGLRTATLTLRIPQTALDGFLAGTGDCGRVTSRSESATDVTASYQDTQARLNTQLALMERLQALIPESATLGDLLALESQIADTQYQIDTLTASLAATDRQVAYSTVTVTLQEETTPELTDTTVPLGQRLMTGLRTGCDAILDFAQDMLVFLVAALPFLGIVGVVVLVIVVIRKVGRRNPK